MISGHSELNQRSLKATGSATSLHEKGSETYLLNPMPGSRSRFFTGSLSRCHAATEVMAILKVDSVRPWRRLSRKLSKTDVQNKSTAMAGSMVVYCPKCSFVLV